MIPKYNRLKKQKDIKIVLQRGKRLKEKFLVLKLKPNKLEKTRFAFIVSQKVSKKATSRNKIKRRLRSLIKLRFEEFKKGIDVIIIAIPGLEKQNLQEIEKSLNALLVKSKILR